MEDEINERLSDVNRKRKGAAVVDNGGNKGIARGGLDEILTEDRMVEILHRNPAKYAVQCKSVGKLWYSLISNPYFLKIFNSYHRSIKYLRNKECDISGFRNQLFVISPSNRDHGFQFSIDFLPFFSDQTRNLNEQQELPNEFSRFVVGSFNGLLLCTSRIINQELYFICNPITKHWIALPPAPLSTGENKVYTAFAFDPHYSNFKIIRVFASYRIRAKKFEAMVFSSETGRWTPLIVSFPRPFRWSGSREDAVFYHGLLHWPVGMHDNFEKQILIYDINKNKVRLLIDFPEDRLQGCASNGLRISCGKLCISQFNRYSADMRIWQLNYDSNLKHQPPKWGLKRDVNLQLIIRNGRSWLQRLTQAIGVLAIHRHNPNILYLSFHSKIVVSCSLETKTLKKVYQSHDLKINPRIIEFYRTYESCSIMLPLWPAALPPIRK